MQTIMNMQVTDVAIVAVVLMFAVWGILEWINRQLYK
jgi:Tfp pilus assembly protein FimT